MGLSKRMKRWAAMAFGGLLICAYPMFGQDAAADGEVRGGVGQKLNQLERIAGDFPDEVESQVDEYKDASAALRERLLSENYLGSLSEDATEDERRAVIERFRSDNAEDIEAARTLRRETLASVRDSLRHDRDGPDINVRRLIHKYKKTKQRLHGALRKMLAELPDGATEEEIERVKDSFEETYAEQIAANEALGARIRSLLQDDETMATETIDRSVLSPGLRDQRRAYRENLRQTIAVHRELRAQLRDMSEEERRNAIADMREQLRTDLRELKQQRRDAIRERVDEIVGERRPDD